MKKWMNSSFNRINNKMTQCILCANNHVKPVLRKDKLELLFCEICNMRFIDGESPCIKEADEKYDKDYYHWWEDDNNILNLKKRTYKNILSYIKDIIVDKNKCNLLDVGCATGRFMEMAENAGFSVSGVEISSYAASIAAQRFPGRVYKCDIDDCHMNDCFDVITMMDVLEHTNTPVELLRKANRLLKIGGIVVVTCPNYESFMARALGKKWVHINDEHVGYYSPRTISYLFNEMKMEILMMIPLRKYISIYYINEQYKKYAHGKVSECLRILNEVVPSFLLHHPIKMGTGEMLVIGRKNA
jgi:2-polyprenyl-3-methyl-5-hydroxy-6-metoxy-1,4-benzoquinol methylase